MATTITASVLNKVLVALTLGLACAASVFLTIFGGRHSGFGRTAKYGGLAMILVCICLVIGLPRAFEPSSARAETSILAPGP